MSISYGCVVNVLLCMEELRDFQLQDHMCRKDCKLHTSFEKCIRRVHVTVGC